MFTSHSLTIAELREFSLLPFWFWNDELGEQEMLRQMDDFQAHSVHGFVIHPRVGLPRSIGWMSEPMLRLIHFAVEAAAERHMRVVLYDEGMYPSGSSCGQVVAANPLYACRGLARLDLAPGQSVPALPDGQHLLGVFDRPGGARMAVIDRPVRSTIRGLHFVGDGPEEDTPPAADLLNPDAVATFVRLVYDRLYEAVGDHFGTTIMGIFTDEPDLLGRLSEPAAAVAPGTTGILKHVNRYLGYDFTPHLPALWCDDVPDAATRRADYLRAVNHRLEHTYYAQLSDWCHAHDVLLMGHPAEPDDLGLMKHFDVPGQDLVWRWVLPGDRTALEGPQSTQAKCSSSAMIHLGRQRNSNEFCGAYGHEFTFEEMCWLANWCIIRGVNQLIPHAFYYSVRGPRFDERPPDVGPNSPWWNSYFKAFAEHCAQMCWLNTDSIHLCEVAILGAPDSLPWRSAKVCFEHQIDFNYLSADDLGNHPAAVENDGIHLAGMHYRVLIVEDAFSSVAPRDVLPMERAGRLIRYNGNAEELLKRLEPLLSDTVRLDRPQPALRCRRVVKRGQMHLMLFNEGTIAIAGTAYAAGQSIPFSLEPAELRVRTLATKAAHGNVVRI